MVQSFVHFLLLWMSMSSVDALEGPFQLTKSFIIDKRDRRSTHSDDRSGRLKAKTITAGDVSAGSVDAENIMADRIKAGTIRVKYLRVTRKRNREQPLDNSPRREEFSKDKFVSSDGKRINRQDKSEKSSANNGLKPKSKQAIDKQRPLKRKRSKIKSVPTEKDLSREGLHSVQPNEREPVVKAAETIHNEIPPTPTRPPGINEKSGLLKAKEINSRNIQSSFVKAKNIKAEKIRASTVHSDSVTVRRKGDRFERRKPVRSEFNVWSEIPDKNKKHEIIKPAKIQLNGDGQKIPSKSNEINSKLFPTTPPEFSPHNNQPYPFVSRSTHVRDKTFPRLKISLSGKDDEEKENDPNSHRMKSKLNNFQFLGLSDNYSRNLQTEKQTNRRHPSSAGVTNKLDANRFIINRSSMNTFLN
ncbi:uncharacterized protein LOC127701313 [Mytilus californianus]|uniref:uncharacterized protein LOC127701313 n=1 Tax=Mytilus californianus TaxID=6549 RepID=UPI00224561A7|nr:uncharacterized protein LOC127701313 [Mytilus californianus]